MQTLNEHELKFPVKWNYKIIVAKEFPRCLETLAKVLNEFAINEQPLAGLESAKGKYISYRLRVTFNSREQMAQLSNAIANVPGVKFLL